MSLASLYKQQRLTTPAVNVEAGTFGWLLVEGTSVSAFELIQDCGMGGEYTRCFYLVAGSPLVRQETPLRIPWVRYSTRQGAVQPGLIERGSYDGGAVRCLTREDDSAMWRLIGEQFSIQHRAYMLRCVRA
jgi:hypothetical protein